MDNMRAVNEQLKDIVLRRASPPPGDHATAVAEMTFHRRDETSKADNCFFKPLASVVIQGHKRSIWGHKEYHYGEGQCVVNGLDMPSASFVTEASPDRPFLVVSLTLDNRLLTRLAAEIPPPRPADPAGPAETVAIAKTDAELLEAYLSLARLLENPARIPMLAPLIIREIHYRRVNMATSTFHRHFRSVTTLSPLQYQKYLRLYEAQRLMLVEKTDALNAGLEVGYESPTQFNREYKRLFGEPPHRDVVRRSRAGLSSGV